MSNTDGDGARQHDRVTHDSRPYAAASTMLAFCGLVSLVVALYITTNGEPLYGALYTGPALVSFLFSYAVWGVKHG